MGPAIAVMHDISRHPIGSIRKSDEVRLVELQVARRVLDEGRGGLIAGPGFIRNSGVFATRLIAAHLTEAAANMAQCGVLRETM